MLKIAVLALENCLHSTVTGTYDIFSIAGFSSREAGQTTSFSCQADIVLPDDHPVHTFNGIPVSGTANIIDGLRYDIIITPALMGDLEPLLENLKVINWISQQHSMGACICSVCASSFLVAQTGLLAGKKATTHWALAEEFKNRFPKVTLKVEKMLVDEGDIITAGGVTAYQDLCIYLLSRFGSPELASSVSRTLLIDSTRQTQIPYSSYNFVKNHGDDAILQVQSYLEKTYSKVIRIKTLAKSVGLEERTFNRRFKKATGDTPTEYIQGLRIEAARKILETTSKSIDAITALAGYEDTSSFRRLFKKRTGLTPSEYRKRFSVFYGAH